MTVGYITRGDPSVQTMESLLGSYEYDRYGDFDRFFEHQWRIGLRGHVNVSRGRCRLVRMFLEGKGDWLLMVDDDMGWHYNSVERMLEAVSSVATERTLEPWRVVMGGLTFGWLPEGHGIAPVMYEREANGMFVRMTDPPGRGIRRVAGTGAAFLLVHRQMLEQIEKETPPTQAPWFQEIEIPIVDEWDEAGEPTHATTYWVSEDLWFCDRVTSVGGEIYVAQAIEIDHKKDTLLNRALFEGGGLVTA